MSKLTLFSICEYPEQSRRDEARENKLGGNERFRIPWALAHGSLFTIQNVVLAETISLIWFTSGLEKLLSGNFPATLPQILTKFASNNPYPWYKNFLNTFAIPNSQTFAILTMYGELLSGLTLAVLTILLILNINKTFKTILFYLGLVALFSMILMNVNYFFAAGWTSPSTKILNLLMIVNEVIIIWALKEYK